MNQSVNKSEVGYELPAVVKDLTEDLIRNYSLRYPGVFLRTIHVDKETAAKWGFPSLVLQGSQTMNFAAEMLFKAYRERWIENSTLTVKLIKPVFAGDRIVVRGRVDKADRQPSGQVRVGINVWAQNGMGEKVMVGQAEILV